MSEPIRSLQNARIKGAVKLRDRRGRQKQGRIIIEGIREIACALGSGIGPVELFVNEAQIESTEVRDLIERARSVGSEIVEVTSQVFEKISFGRRLEGVIAIAETPRRNLAAIQLPEFPFVAVLDSLEKPGNVGAALRSADGAGVDAVVISDPLTDLFNPNTIRASLGTVFTMPVCCAPAAEVADWLVENSLTVMTADAEGQVDYFDADFRQPSAVVLGSEAHGLSEFWRGVPSQKIRLSMHGAADSLNVSATAAVLFYEAYRQRRSNPKPRADTL